MLEMLLRSILRTYARRYNMNDMNMIFERRSVRKFKDEDVKDKDLTKMLEAAIEAPSAKNLQNWHFVILKNKDMIARLEQIVLEKNEELSQFLDGEQKEKFVKFSKYATIFKNAPVTVLVYAGNYNPTGLDLVRKSGDLKTAEIIEKAAPGIHGVAAAIQNSMLAASSLGYGTCWMTSPNYAIKEIESFIGLEKEGYHLVAITPLGVPEYIGKRPPRKSIDEVVTIIK